MAYSTTVPILSGLAILATMGGVSLGQATIAAINPVHYRPPTSHFYADLVPYRSAGSIDPAAVADDYYQPEPAYSAAPACIGCGGHSVELQSREAAADGLEDGWSASAGAADPPVVDPPAPDPPPANRQWIERYTTYTIVTEVVEPQQIQSAAPEES